MIGREDAATGCLVLFIFALMGIALIVGLAMLSPYTAEDSEAGRQAAAAAQPNATVAANPPTGALPDDGADDLIKALVIGGATLVLLTAPFIAWYMTAPRN